MAAISLHLLNTNVFIRGKPQLLWRRGHGKYDILRTRYLSDTCRECTILNYKYNKAFKRHMTY